MESRSGQIISLPQGGGAQHSLGETFAPDLHTGTGNVQVPLALPHGRNGFQPKLTLAYSTGAGNGAFGLGWSLSVPSVGRRTAHGLPRYDDEHDVFVLSGAEDLVPDTATPAGRRSYHPRSEGLFARIEHVRSASDNYWQVRTGDGLTSIYGTPGAADADPAIITDPQNKAHIFQWNISRTLDQFGNRIDYIYERDPGQAQLYLAQVRYADYGEPAAPQFLITASLLYDTRPDPFSDCRAGFEIRTTRRCRRIEAHVHEGPAPPVRSYRLIYLDERDDLAPRLPPNGVSLLSRLQVIGYDDHGQPEEELPPLEFGYTGFAPSRRHLLPVRGEALPVASLARPQYGLADLNGDGLPDIFELNGSARAWLNLGGGRFGLPRVMQDAPAGVHLDDPGVQLLDADGDGRIDLLVSTPGAGYYPLESGGTWNRHGFRAYRNAPTFRFDDPEVLLIDLDGDGVIDALRSGTRLEAYYNDPEQGWHTVQTGERGALEAFPNLSFADPKVHCGDINGDGLLDLILVSSGLIEYWPSLGYGRWGKRVRMTGSPRFPAGYDPSRILVGDVDGDGLADLIYVGSSSVTLWVNRGGNGWSAPLVIQGTPMTGRMETLRLADLLGSGTTGLLWSRDTAGTPERTMDFLDFTGGSKPYLLNEINNHMGAITRISYAPSTRFAAADARKAETRWKTTLPFPVQVVARVEIVDAISGGTLTSEYRYHHGYWDGAEREFVGFGVVEQLDCETLPAQPDLPTPQLAPPLLTRTWFHQGAVGRAAGEWQELDYHAAFWPGDASLLARPPETVALLAGLPRRARRDAVRTLRGSILRREQYALDGSERENRPYTVHEYAYGLREVELGTSGKWRVFFPHLTAQRITQWERGDDPQTRLIFFADYDEFGRPLAEVRVACPRGWRAWLDVPGVPFLATRTRTTYATPIDPAIFINDRVARTTAYELVNQGQLDLKALLALPPGDPAIRMIADALTWYDGAAFTGEPHGTLGRFGMPVRSEALVSTAALLQTAYTAIPPYLSGSVTDSWPAEYPAAFAAQMLPGAGFTRRSEPQPAYYAVSEQRSYDFHAPHLPPRGLVRGYRDTRGHDTLVDYDAPYHLLPVRVQDPAGLVTQAVYNYRVMQPETITDPNGTITRFSYTPLGLMHETFVRGTAGEGDLARPGTRVAYALRAFFECAPGERSPIYVQSTRRVYHESDSALSQAEREQVIESRVYSDGFGRQIQTRAQAEEVIYGDERDGSAVLPADPADGAATRQAITGHTAAQGQFHVVVSERRVYDNKGRVIATYKPFFARGWDYAPDEGHGHPTVFFYDALGRLARTVYPDGSERRMVFGRPHHLAEPDHFAPSPWETYAYDANDNAGHTHAAASQAYRQHWNTPSSSSIDALGRTTTTTRRTRTALADAGSQPAPVEEQTTGFEYDIRGNLLRVIDANGRQTYSAVYDLANRVLRSESSDAGLRLNVYDGSGNIIEQRDGRGTLILHAYDVLLRPASRWARNALHEPVTLRERLIYGDDAAGSGLASAPARAAYLHGRLYRHDHEAGCIVYERYSVLGSPLEQVHRVVADAAITPGQPFCMDWQASTATLLDPAEYRLSYRYDALGRVTLLRYPQDAQGARRALRPRYNRAGALDGVMLDNDTFVERTATTAQGQPALVAFGNGLLARYAYDPRSERVLRLRVEGFHLTGPQTLLPDGPVRHDCTYAYDLAGNLLTLRDHTPGSGIPNSVHGLDLLERHFTYDPLYRLLSATGRECDLPVSPQPWDERPACYDITRARSYTEGYRYDTLDNLVELAHSGSATRTMTLLPGTNRIQRMTAGQTGFDYAYDPSGNLIREAGTRRFDWDYADRLVAFRIQPDGAPASIAASYLYDSSGRRVKKLVQKGGLTEVTVMIGGLFEHRRRGTLQNTTLHVPAQRGPIASVRVGPAFPGEPAPAVQYHLGDHPAGVTLSLDASGALVSREEATPYGEASFGRVGRQRYQGHAPDQEEALYCFGARYYAPWLARWLSCDPAGAMDGPNLYHYAANNPVSYGDPSGLQAQTEQKATTATRDEKIANLECKVYNPALDGFVPAKGTECLPAPGKVIQSTSSSSPPSGAQAGSPGSASQGTSSQQSSSAAADSENRSLWDRGGGTLVTGGVGLAIGVVLLASNPVGWVVGLTAALAIASGAAGVGIGISQLATSGSRTAEQDAVANEQISTALTFASSPGAMLGGMAGMMATGDEEGLRTGSIYGGLAEAGGTFAYGAGSMAYREYRFSQSYRGSAYRWNAPPSSLEGVKPAIRQAYGIGNAADRVRPNALFYRSREYVDLSHFVPQRSIGGYESLFNRPWNVTPMWATEHAMVDAYRYQRMTPAFKAVYEGQQLQGLERAMQLTPPWMLQSGYGLSRGTYIMLQ